MTDWIMIGITIVYVVATIVICIFNAKSANAAKEQTKEIQRQFSEIHRPKIDLKFEITNSGLMFFIIENNGVEPAIDLSINLNNEFFSNIMKHCNIEEIQKGFSIFGSKNIYLASRQKIEVCISGVGHFHQIASIPAKFDLTYNNKYTESITIDIKQYGYRLSFNTPIEEISKLLNKAYLNQIEFQKQLLEQNKQLFKKPLFVTMRSIDDIEKQKFAIYKIVALNSALSLKDIAEKIDLPLERTHKLLLELNRVDDLVSVYMGIDPYELNEETIWTKKY